jgi:MoxR-like ATPase
MTYHFKLEEVKVLVNVSMPVMLTGEKGSGKTTLAKQVAEALDLDFYSISMTRQTTLSHLLGYMSVDGTYIPSILHKAITHGGLYLLDEIDAGDANVLLSLNTIENGYLSFPTGIVECHKDFRLMSTANPQNEHHHYTGRSKLDAATLDRFDIIDIDRDQKLEATLVDRETLRNMNILRKIVKNANSDIVVSMRDSLRYQTRKNLNVLNDFVYRLVGKSNLMFDNYNAKIKSLPKYADQSECKTFPDLVNLLKSQQEVL